LDEPTSPTQNYRVVMHETFAPLYRPEDIYIGTLMSLLVALNGGITTVCDNAHNSRSHEHAVASIEAIKYAGLRGIFAFGRARSGTSNSRFPDNAYRLRRDYFASDEGMHAMRLFMRGRDPLDEIKEALTVRRDLDLWISFDTGFGIQPVVELYEKGLLDGRETINHGNFVAAEKMRAVAEHGGTVNVCPRIETQFRCGDIPYRDWRDSGLTPAISNDDPATYPINTFQEMRILYSQERAKVYRAQMRGDADVGELVTLREMLEAATMQGARNCGLADRVGSITPGKQADLVLIDTNNVQLFPKANAYCTVVQGGDPAFVDTVFVAGALKKWRGELLDIDFAAIQRRVEQSRDRLFAAASWPLESIDVS
jgi:cytosine/adenosine deaminase-related metal-dependent hydrolase